MLRKVAATVAIAVVVLSGCAAGPSMSETAIAPLAQGKARVYFYRTTIVGSAHQPEVTLNGDVVGNATPRGVYFRDVSPGHYIVTTSMTNEKVHLLLAAGQKRYVRLGYRFGFNVYPELVEESIGETEVQDLSYVVSAK